MTTFLQRFWAYQLERFPIPVLLFTTLAVVLSSSTVLQTGDIQWIRISMATFLGLIQLFHIRAIDEFRDFHHDQRFHHDRPVQQGIISLKELGLMDQWGILLFLMLTAVSGMKAFLIGLIALGFSFVAGKEFFLGESFRRNFFVYNAVNILQMLWLQFLIYAVLDPGFELQRLSIWAHFLFAFTNSIIIEIVRKIRIPPQETLGRDTYSWHMGFWGSIALFLSFTVLNYLLFIWNAGLISRWQTVPLAVSLFVIALVIGASAVHGFLRQKKTEHLLIGVTLLSYLTLHIVLFLL